ncbi:hypothetical protein HMI54_012630 [Coelomomyces lativittatus]|nr:hypothetical protein HMI56_001916 [Coelomomyces lativittatus]KAJ1515247.1 hypothetical protein HMI54_012630 [Coelomomyces lativittatus]KAJ1517696.1 hypothetical protein HMI55_006286 [Coelomomyces lativittatus]
MAEKNSFALNHDPILKEENGQHEVDPSLGRLTYPNAPIHEIAEFYSISHCAPKPDRPYMWSNSIISLDGYLSFLESDDMGVEGISMKSRFPHLSKVDFKMLHAGWAHADAILISASCLRNEPKAQIRVLFEDLIDYRINVLGKKTRQPALLVLTKSGNVPFPTHPTFQQLDDQEVHFILTSTTPDAPTPSLPNVHVINTLTDLMTWCIHQKYQFIDCATGGQVIQQCLQLKLIDEMRITYAAQLSGPLNLHQILRPSLFPVSPPTHFSAKTSPHLLLKALRTCGQRLIFLRMELEYRHSMKNEENSVEQRSGELKSK